MDDDYVLVSARSPEARAYTHELIHQHVTALLRAEDQRREAIAADFLMSGAMPRDLSAVSPAGVGVPLIGPASWRLA